MRHKSSTQIAQTNTSDTTKTTKASNTQADYKDMLTQAKTLAIGQDLSLLRVPASFVLPLSTIDLNLLGTAAAAPHLLDALKPTADAQARMLCVLKATLATCAATLVPASPPKKPFNPVLGEVQLACDDDSEAEPRWRCVCEQVSHHPPLTALHLEGSAAAGGGRVLVTSVFRGTPIFRGNLLEVAFSGPSTVRLELPGGDVEEYCKARSPSMNLRGVLGLGRRFSEWSGAAAYSCEQTGLCGELHFHPSGFLGIRGAPHRVSGSVGAAAAAGSVDEQGLPSPMLLIEGRWTERIVVRCADGDGDPKLLWECAGFRHAERLPERLPYELPAHSTAWPQHSHRVWRELTDALVNKEFGRARAAKGAVESQQRKLAKDRAARGEMFAPAFWRASGSPGDPTAWQPAVDKIRAAFRTGVGASVAA